MSVHASDRLWRLAVDLNKCPAHPVGIIESHGSSNLFNRLRAVKQAHSGRFDTKSFDGLGRCLTRFSTKGAAKLSNAEVRRLGKTLDW